MKRTDLNLEELQKELDPRTATLPCPRCLIVNEIGEICVTGDREAEAVLRGLLASPKQEDQAIAYCWLSETANVEEETFLKLDEFRKNPANKETLEMAEEAIKNRID